MFLVHNASYFLPDGGWITNDYAARRAQANMSADGGSSAPQLPGLPAGLPSTWLQPYAGSTNCTWRFDLPESAMLSLYVE